MSNHETRESGIVGKIFTVLTDKFCDLNELVNPLLVTYIAHKELTSQFIPHKFVLGFYNADDYSYKHIWIEHNNIIYDLSNYINDRLLKAAPIERINARYYDNKDNLYTDIPRWNRVDMTDEADRDYDIIVDKLFYKLLAGDDEEYLADMPKKYKDMRL